MTYKNPTPFEAAFNDGLTISRNGETADNPHPQGSDLANWWDDGYNFDKDIKELKYEN
jgi:hypothetical protein